ncbi:MAG TPA: UPF0149 family protein [Burkholderiaceae bacterium]|nr:UPF0149 family protein [Burkholderiaceae bacterium]
MNPTADLTDAEVGELDDLLAAIPEPLQALDAVMLDGYLCGVLAQPVRIPAERWLPPAFDWNFHDGTDAAPSGQALGPDTPGWHHARHERLLALVQRRHAALERALREDGWFDPLVMTPEDEQGNELQGQAAIQAALAPWTAGFSHALDQFPALESLAAADLPDLLACVFRHLPEQDEEEAEYTRALDAEHPLENLDAAIEDLVGNVVQLADIGRNELLKVTTVRRETPKVGRNDPCPCGSGKKFKQCHGRGPNGA